MHDCWIFCKFAADFGNMFSFRNYIIVCICAALMIGGTAFAANPAYSITSVSLRVEDKFNDMDGLCFDLNVEIDDYKGKETQILGELCSKDVNGKWVPVPTTEEVSRTYVCNENTAMAKAKKNFSCTYTSSAFSNYQVFLPYNAITHPSGAVDYKIRFWMRDAKEDGVFILNKNGSFFHEYYFSLTWPSEDNGERYEIKSASHRLGDKFNKMEGLCFDLNVQIDKYKGKDILIFGELQSKDGNGNWVPVPSTGKNSKDYKCHPNTVMARAKSKLSCTQSRTNDSKYEVFLPYDAITHPSGTVDYKIRFWMRDAKEDTVFISNKNGSFFHEYYFSLIWPSDNRTQTNSTGSQTSTTKTTTSSASQIQRPTCTILSPATNSTYKSSFIKLRYIVNADYSSNYSVKFYVAGREVKPLNISLQKGAQSLQGTEVELPMPQEAGRETVVSVQVADANGIIWDQKSITLKYINERKPTLHVFAVGVNKYKAEGFQSLAYAVKDARDFVNTIMDMADKDMYWNVDTTLIIDEAATTFNLQRQLLQLGNRVQDGDVVMMFFSGHGIREEEESYFITSDALWYINGLNTDDITTQIQKMKKKNCKVFVFMDACHSGAMAVRTKGSYMKPITLAEANVVGYYSCAENQKSEEKKELRNGVFTYALKEGLKGKASNGEGQITIYQLYDFIRQWVYSETTGKQSPTIDYKGSDYIIFYKKR